MSVFPFQSNARHTGNIRRACTERRTQDHKFFGVEHKPCLHHSQSSEARLDMLANEEELQQGKHHLYLTHQQNKCKSETSVQKAQSNENIMSAFTKPDAWKLAFGSNDGGFKIESLAICSNGNLSQR